MTTLPLSCKREHSLNYGLMTRFSVDKKLQHMFKKTCESNVHGSRFLPAEGDTGLRAKPCQRGPVPNSEDQVHRGAPAEWAQAAGGRCQAAACGHTVTSNPAQKAHPQCMQSGGRNGRSETGTRNNVPRTWVGRARWADWALVRYCQGPGSGWAAGLRVFIRQQK